MHIRRQEAVQRRRRIIYSNDGNDCSDMFAKRDEPVTPENFLSKRTTALAGSQVDAIFYCDGVFNLYTHKSDESEPRVHSDRYQEDWAWKLTEQGNEPLNLMIEFGKRHGMEVFWSMRMNDTHDSADDALFCSWKRENPHCLMGKETDTFPYGGNRWSAVDYGLEGVRDKVLSITRDVCSRYDVDGIELDFFRHPVYFKPQMYGEPITPEHCSMMTDLMGKIRKMVEEVERRRNRPLLIAIRVPDSVGYAKAIGLDIVAWLKQDLFDILSGGGYFHLEPWENLVKLGRQYDKPVYPCLSNSRLCDTPEEYHDREGDLEKWRGEAANAWEAGVSGIYVYNRFDPESPLYRELGSFDILKTLDKTYVFDPGKKRNMERWLKDGSMYLKERER